MPPPARSVRQRAVANENDENAPTRVTRAKAAAALGGADELSAGVVRKALQTKKSVVGTTGTQRKRAALGDLSNVVKTSEPADAKEGKKPAAGRQTLLSKAAQNGGVQKPSRAATTRSALAAKDSNKTSAATELKRPGSGSGVMGPNIKKRSVVAASSRPSIKEEAPAAENEPPRKKSHIPGPPEQTITTVTKETIKVEEVKSVSSEKAVLSFKIPDLDAEDLEDHLMVAEYAVEIFDYLRDLETTTMPNPDYMEHQDHLNWHERDILNDWLIQVHQKFQLLPETLYLAINIIDRFLSTKIVQLDKLQLVGITAMFIASKYEEVMSPHVSNFSYIAKDYQDSEILSAERFILTALNYDLSYPNPMNFLRRISKADNYEIQTRTLAKYLLEISCLDHRFMEFPPSLVAAAAMYMARQMLSSGTWDPIIAHYAGYTEDEIMPVFNLMVGYCSGEIKHEAFHAKYASKKYLKASLVVRRWTKRYVEHISRRSSSTLSTKDVDYR